MPAEKKKARKATKKVKIWTEAYNPFVMGGSCHYALGTKVEADGPHDLGKGRTGYLVTAPDGSTCVAEATSGAIVGPDLETVRGHVEAAEEAVMEKQVADALERGGTAKMVEPEEFWRLRGNLKKSESAKKD